MPPIPLPGLQFSSQKQSVAQTASVASSIQFNPSILVASPDARLKASNPSDFRNPVTQSQTQTSNDSLPSLAPSLGLPAFGPAQFSDGSLAGSPEFALASGQSGPQGSILSNPILWVAIVGLGAGVWFLTQ